MELRPSLFCLFFCLLYFFLPPFEDLGCFSGCLMSSTGIQKLFCGICLAFKCSFDEFVGEKVFSPSYSSAILAPPPHFSLSCIGEGNGTPLQYSCLENPRDGGAWWAAVYGVSQSQTWLKRLSSSSGYSIEVEYTELVPCVCLVSLR